MSRAEKMKARNIYYIYIFFVLATVLIFFSNQNDSWAKVTGICSNCHTMHNSQNGTFMAISGNGVGWNDSGELTGASPSSSPLSNLLLTDCVGCHSSIGSNTIITVPDGSDIPIVYNMSVPTTPLAGGNFYWVAQGNDSMGHNVYGISEADSLTQAPGKLSGECGDSCHTSLALPPDTNDSNRTGCEGCHVFVAHHDDSRPWYRFLKGHSTSPVYPFTGAENGTDYVLRTTDPVNEDEDWEFTTNPATNDHNLYKGTDESYSTNGPDLSEQQTITAFCSGCHGRFHGPKLDGEGMGSASPWLRHPTDILLPNTSEYAGYDPVNNYSVEAPVAWLDPENRARADAVVMCLSCHRAHGSDQPDLLRWNYTGMIVGGGGSTGGCFTCHTTKDGS